MAGERVGRWAKSSNLVKGGKEEMKGKKRGRNGRTARGIRSHTGWNARRMEGKMKRVVVSRLLSGEVLEAAALFKDGLCELLEHSVHVGALPRPQTLQEADVAAVTCDEQCQVGILLHHLHWNGCEGRKAKVSVQVSNGRSAGSEAAENSP